MLIAEKFQKIVLAIHRQGHGGALVVSNPKEESWKTDVTFSVEFDQESSIAILNALLELNKALKTKEEYKVKNSEAHSRQFLSLLDKSVEAHENLLSEILKNIGELSRIDGAVVTPSSIQPLPHYNHRYF